MEELIFLKGKVKIKNMSSRSLNKVMLIGNLTRDPELRYTPNGTPVVTFGLATNRSWMPEGTNERREETEFHRIVAWNKLADLCSQLLYKGVKVYVEGRLSTRSWTGQDGVQKSVTEVVIDDMIVLDKKGDRVARSENTVQREESAKNLETKSETETIKEEKSKAEENKPAEIVNPEDIPF